MLGLRGRLVDRHLLEPQVAEIADDRHDREHRRPLAETRIAEAAGQDQRDRDAQCEVGHAPDELERNVRARPPHVGGGEAVDPGRSVTHQNPL